MNYSKKQSELDVMKWYDSEVKNYDTCGEYNYCANCNKSEAYPCAYAYERFTNLAKSIKSTTKNATTKKLKTSTTTKKSTAKKATTTRKTTTKKTTKA